MDALRLVPIGLLLVVAAGLGFGIGLRVFPASVLAVMGPAALWAFGIALLMPGTTTSALAGFAAIAGAASALTGFLQVGGGSLDRRSRPWSSGPLRGADGGDASMAALAALVHLGLAGRKLNPSSGS
jgi:DHA1 family bicyclomycin/chloramphenicol resistance-like MFS transporter